MLLSVSAGNIEKYTQILKEHLQNPSLDEVQSHKKMIEAEKIPDVDLSETPSELLKSDAIAFSTINARHVAPVSMGNPEGRLRNKC